MLPNRVNDYKKASSIENLFYIQDKQVFAEKIYLLGLRDGYSLYEVAYKDTSLKLLEEMIMTEKLDFIINQISNVEKKIDSIGEKVHSIDIRLSIIESRLDGSKNILIKFIWPLITGIIGGLVVVFATMLISAP